MFTVRILVFKLLLELSEEELILLLFLLLAGVETVRKFVAFMDQEGSVEDSKLIASNMHLTHLQEQ